MPLDAGFDFVSRTHLDLLRENGGRFPWCGPAALALAAGLSCTEACALLRQVDPVRYPAEAEIVITYWRDLLEALRHTGTAWEVLDVRIGAARSWPRLTGFIRRASEPGWYLLRVTDHFLLLHLRASGLALVHDNRHTAVPAALCAYRHRRVTHAVRLHGAPGLSGGFGFGPDPVRALAA